MLIEANASGERKIGTDAHEHPPPPLVIDVEVVLNDPAICDLKVPSVGLAIAHGRHDAGRLARLENHNHFVGLGSVEVGINEVIAAALRGFDNRDVPLASPSLEPSLELLGNAPQRAPTHWIKLPIRVEEANDALRLLERLNQSIQKDAIKATVVPTNAVLVVFIERVHENPRRADLSRVMPSLNVLYGRADGWDIKGEALG